MLTYSLSSQYSLITFLRVTIVWKESMTSRPPGTALWLSSPRANMAIKMKSIQKLNLSSGQISAAIFWIVSQNIKVSPLNMTYQRNYFIFAKDVSDKIVKETGFPLRFFTETEDEEILQRIQFLEKNGVITSAIGLCKELKEGNELPRANADKADKSRRRMHREKLRIIGLYLCQNLTNRLAYYTTERLLKLVDKLTATPKKVETVTRRRPWTIDDDKIIVKSVLFDNISQRYNPFYMNFNQNRKNMLFFVVTIVWKVSMTS